jgi:hypothetical protein
MSQDIETPRTINDIELGDISDFTVVGPARLCVGDMFIDLAEQETGIIQYLGIHNAAVVIADGQRTFELSVSDSFARQPGSAQILMQDREAIIEQHGRSTRARFSYSPWNADYEAYRLRVVIDDDEVRRSNVALRIFQNIGFFEDQPDNCDRSFDYGWQALLGDGVGERQ